VSRETVVSRHHEDPIEGPQNSHVHHSTIILRGLRGALNWFLIIWGVACPDSKCWFFPCGNLNVVEKCADTESIFFQHALFVWLGLTHPTPGIEARNWTWWSNELCDQYSTSSVSTTQDTRPRWWISQFNRLILPGVTEQLSFSCRHR